MVFSLGKIFLSDKEISSVVVLSNYYLKNDIYWTCHLQIFPLCLLLEEIWFRRCFSYIKALCLPSDPIVN